MTDAILISSSTPGRVHGGQDELGVAAHDFSTNSNACGPCPAALQALGQADPRAYPDAAYRNLRQTLAGFHGVDSSRILLAASASEFIFRITSAVARLNCSSGSAAVWFPPHAYGDYAQAARAHGLEAAVTAQDAALAWACEPSSPLGSADVMLESVAAGAAAALAGTIPLVLDAAYQPLRLSGRASLSANQCDLIWQLVTPNKALGLTGVRAAYAIAPIEAGALATVVEALCPSWPVGTHGVAMLEAWTTPSVQMWLAESLETLRRCKARQIDLCTSLGWTCLPSDANFFCAKPDIEGEELQSALQALRKQGIKLRDTTSFNLPGLVRLGVLPPASQDALRDAWQQIRNGKTA